jgi:hypothetical protein
VKVVAIEQKWDPGAQEFVEYLQAEIAKAMVIPAYLLDDRWAMARAQQEVYQCTAVMRRELERLVVHHFHSVVVVEK